MNGKDESNWEICIIKHVDGSRTPSREKKSIKCCPSGTDEPVNESILSPDRTRVLSPSHSWSNLVRRSCSMDPRPKQPLQALKLFAKSGDKTPTQSGNNTDLLRGCLAPHFTDFPKGIQLHSTKHEKKSYF